MSSPKSNAVIINPGLCRCCRTVKKCRLLTHEYTWMNMKEIYSEMFMDCFGLLLSHLDGEEAESCVCATCVVRLREACAFRMQVLKCEQLFLKGKIQINTVEPMAPEIVDVKPLDLSDRESVSGHEETDHTEDHKEVKCEIPTPESSPSITRRNSTLRGRRNVALRKRIEGNAKEQQKILTNVKIKNSLSMKRIGGSFKSKILMKTGTASMAKNVRKYLSIKRKPTEHDPEHMKETNMINLVEYSYVCPFTTRFSSYFCFYCNQQCTDTTALREHTSSHDPKEYKTCFKKRKPKLKVDITRIDCRLCSEKIDDVETFSEHITSNHNKKFYGNITDAFLKFRLTDENLTCTVCNAIFPYFDKLHKHMVEHYGNYTCDVCGQSFLVESKLKSHLSVHNFEKYSCETCGRDFPTENAKMIHINNVHDKVPTIACRRCDTLLLTYCDRDRHMIDVHGESDNYPCTKCDKVYFRKKSLNEHFRRVHIKQNRHPCEYCSERFFTPSLLRDHLTTHTGEKNFRCEYCDKTYPRFKTLQQHIRIHTNDRRYKCVLCSSAFVQNVSLKCHMKSHHPDYVVNKS